MSFTAQAWWCWYQTAVMAIWSLSLWHFHFVFNCTLVIMVLFCIYLMVLWWRSGDTFYFIWYSISLDLLLLCLFLFGTEYLLNYCVKGWMNDVSSSMCMWLYFVPSMLEKRKWKLEHIVPIIFAFETKKEVIHICMSLKNPPSCHC